MGGVSRSKLTLASERMGRTDTYGSNDWLPRGQALIKTPVPDRLESPIGFLLRLAEVNGFSSPKPLIALAMRRAEYAVTVGWDYRRLQPLMAEVEIPEEFGYRHRAYTRGQGLIAGQRIATHHLGIGKSRICPECVKESGYLASHFDLKAYVACHRHGRIVVKKCHACGWRLTYRRRGLLTCRCGADLASGPIEIAPRSLLAISEILHAKVTGARGELPIATTLGFPVDELWLMDVDILCRVLVTLAERISEIAGGGYRRKSSTEVATLLPEVGRYLSNWPYNFYTLCDKWRNLKNVAKCNAQVFQDRFNWLFVRTYKNLKVRKQQTLFLIKACLEYGMRTWDAKPIVLREKALLKMELPEARYGTYEAAARFLGRSRRTADRRLQAKRLPGLIVRFGRRRGCVDMDMLRNLSFSLPPVLRGDAAAKALGMPRPVFRELRKSNHIKRVSIGRRYRVTTSAELNQFEAEIIRHAVPSRNRKLVSVSDLMRSYMPVPTKADLIRKIIDGSVDAFYRSKPQGLSDLLVHASVVDGILSSLRGGKISASGLGRRYRLSDPEALALAMKMGAISRGKGKGKPYLIDLNRVEEFMVSHVPLRSLVSGSGVGALAVRNAMHERAIDVVRLPTKVPRQPFATFIKKSAVREVRRMIRARQR